MPDPLDTFVTERRAAKVRRLVDHLGKEVLQQIHTVLDGLTDSDWLRMCTLAGVSTAKPPSAETRQAVKDEIRRRLLPKREEV